MKRLSVLVIVAIIFSLNLWAKDVNCEIKFVVKCQCLASMNVDCGGQPGVIRDYYALKYNKWVRSKIKGLGAEDEISLAKGGMVIDGDTILYKDTNAKRQAGKASGKTSMGQ